MSELRRRRITPYPSHETNVPNTNIVVRAMLHGTLDKPTAILAHGGLGGTGHDAVQYAIASRLTEAGISSLRLNMYSSAENTRNSPDFTPEQYAGDLTAVIEHLHTEGTPRIGVVGHSVGGLAVLMAPDVDATVLLDPSHGDDWQPEPDEKIDTPVKLYPGEEIIGDVIVNRLGVGYVQSVSAMEAWVAMGDTTHLAAGRQNLLVISAENREARCQQYVDVAGEPKEHLVLEGADHAFTTGNAAEVVADETVVWLGKYLLDS